MTDKHVEAAVAAALRKAAEECTLFGYNDMAMQILALPHDDSALREICMRVADAVQEDARNSGSGGISFDTPVTTIVDRVLKGE